MRLLLVFLIIFARCQTVMGQLQRMMHLSHDATVRVFSPSGNSSGSGFLVSDRLVLTCLHVVVTTQRDNQGLVQGRAFEDLNVILSTGEVIQADLVSTPSEADLAPLKFDFAFLKLRTKPKVVVPQLSLADDQNLSSIDIGDDVIFSGYPLATPGMLTHKGMISGFAPDKSVLAIEGPVNKGNSGGALVNSRGQVIGIVSLREGGITQGLAELRDYTNKVSQSGSKVLIMGMDPMASTKMLIDTIDQYISVGIGYALSINHAREYMTSHPAMTKT